jgi:hypothetical protein
VALWKITDTGPTVVPPTHPQKEKLLEADLENWVVTNPDILGEPLLVIGRQVLIPDIRDRLDVLALDTAGNAVIIELKRGKLKDPVDIQALRYASYIAKWRFEDFEREARNFLGKTSEPAFNFNAMYEEFCSDAGVDETPEVNVDQRLVIVGSDMRDKLGSVALWLREHSIDIKVVEVHSYREGASILIEPAIIVPLPVSKFVDTGKPKDGGLPWTADGKSWHLNQRCSPQTLEMFVKLDDILRDNFVDLDGPRWNQKHYVAYKINNFNWLAVVTSSKTLRLDFLVKKGALSADHVAQLLGVEKFDTEESLSEKMNLPSSVLVKNRNEQTDRLYLRIKEGFDVSSEAFIKFLEEAHRAFPK